MRPFALATVASLSMRGAAATISGAIAASCLAGLGASPPCAGPGCAAACPRDAAQDAAGRCACGHGTARVLGACVPLRVADAYCGPAARMTADGCVFRACVAGEALDLALGSCIPQASVLRSGVCSQGTSAVVADGRFACVAPDATCPRGARLAVGDGGTDGLCARPVQCPPGTLPDGPEQPTRARSCRPIVTVGPGGRSTVDVGAWAALVFGPDGGLGSAELCRPLAQRPDVFGLSREEAGAFALRILLTVPDQDMARVHARVELEPGRRERERRARGGMAGALASDASDGHAHGDGGESPDQTDPARPAPAWADAWPSAAQAAAADAVETLLEPLRGLGGEATAAEVKVEVRCPLALP